MSEADTNVVELFSGKRIRLDSPAQRCREIDGDMKTLQDMSQRLQQMKVLLQEASDAFINAITNDTRLEAEGKLDTLNTLVNALDLNMQSLVVAMARHREALLRSASPHG